MASPSPQSLRQVALADLEHEISQTRRVLERVPDEHLSWKPHEKSFSLGALALHIANLLEWQRTILTTEELDVATTGRLSPPESREELLRTFDANADALRQALGAADDGALTEPWTLRNGEHTVFTLPRVAVLRSAGISHIVHHRGQLTVYLRLLDVPLPGVYGPTADEIRGS